MDREALLALAERKHAKADRMWANWAMADPRRLRRANRLWREAAFLRALAATSEGSAS